MEKFKKFIIIFGLEYSVLWSVVIYFVWKEGPFIYTILDTIAGIVVIYLGYEIYKDKPVPSHFNYLYIGLILASLVYNSIWTLVIMLFLEIDLAGLGLPLDLVSLYATVGLSYNICLSVHEHYHDMSKDVSKSVRS